MNMTAVLNLCISFNQDLNSELQKQCLDLYSARLQLSPAKGQLSCTSQAMYTIMRYNIICIYIYTVIGIYAYNVYSALYLFVVVGKSHVVQVVARRF